MDASRHPARLTRYTHNFWVLARDSANGWMDHNASRTGAALAFYTVFSLAPILLLSIAIAGIFFGLYSLVLGHSNAYGILDAAVWLFGLVILVLFVNANRQGRLRTAMAATDSRGNIQPAS